MSYRNPLQFEEEHRVVSPAEISNNTFRQGARVPPYRIVSPGPVVKDDIDNHTRVEIRCPFRLLDCDHFLDCGELSLREFKEDFLCATVNTDPESFERMDSWTKLNGLSWVAVSYDSTVFPASKDLQGISFFEVGLDRFPIRHDVLKLLCIFAKGFGAKYLWLDKLCVYQDKLHVAEQARWRMPGNMKWVFGCARGTFVLLNGLCKLPPSLPVSQEPRSTSSPVFTPAPDFIYLLQPFLELAFTRSLQDVRILLTPIGFPLVPIVGLAQDNFEAATLPLEKFLRSSSQAGRLCLGGDFNPEWTVPINTFKPPPRATEMAVEITYSLPNSGRRQAETLLSLLSCRDQLNSYNAALLDTRNIEEKIGEWEEAIWHTFLRGRQADTCEEFVFGLAWLLQDLCDAWWRIEETKRKTENAALEHQDQYEDLWRRFGSTVSISPIPQLYPMQPYGNSYYPYMRRPRREAMPRPDLVTCVMAASREFMDKWAKEARVNTRLPFMQRVLPVLIDRFNHIRGPSQKVVDAIGIYSSWDVPCYTWWVSWKAKHESWREYHAWQHVPELDSPLDLEDYLGQLHLAIVDQPNGKGAVLALVLRGPTHRGQLPKSNIVTRRIPAKIWRKEEDANQIIVQYFDLCQHESCEDTWKVFQYCADDLEEQSVWMKRASRWPIQAWRLTPVDGVEPPRYR